MKKVFLGLLALGLTAQLSAQVVNDGMLPEVEVRATNYKYLNSVDNTEAAVPVKLLEDMVAKFDVKSSEFYEDGNDFYRVYFYIPEGKIVAAYDRDGKILYTIEKFKNVALPDNVASAVAERFPGWSIDKDVYRVNYDVDLGTNKRYKLVLKNGKKTIRVKVDEDGVFL
ncbi:nicotinate-nucleotide adenylyltransferase [Lutimonas saemankumensis]|uniref:nicotinate-nucleotide adenylyltransferase n=1 Tax=Lutimonas saemankumensis TaxID=483016 RepID=UPI001CD7760A|nr:nicotinate-nucleotide adenylyltransferase [Lutimonas saemankumensis]MCA0932769.1 nicotinate-nucleotide adenylyltransferase [Lutimonas saemankumensis]